MINGSVTKSVGQNVSDCKREDIRVNESVSKQRSEHVQQLVKAYRQIFAECKKKTKKQKDMHEQTHRDEQVESQSKPGLCRVTDPRCPLLHYVLAEGCSLCMGVNKG